ncbi:MAG: hypothetical protein FJX95_08825 [Bacteroidetes bacterium]|nr:hypothetical protein [Bacteroidota bacterium]
MKKKASSQEDEAYNQLFEYYSPAFSAGASAAASSVAGASSAAATSSLASATTASAAAAAAVIACKRASFTERSCFNASAFADALADAKPSRLA